MTSSPRRFLPYGRQQISDDDVAAVTDVLRGNTLTTGPKAVAFEQTLAEATGVTHAVACSSGAAALHLAAMALNLGPGDKVVVPTLTFLATANVVRMTGAEVVFADVDPATGLMGPENLVAALAQEGSEKVKAIFPVHYAGQCVAPDQLAAVANSLSVVADSCHALGTAYGSDGKVGDCRHAVRQVLTGIGGYNTDGSAHGLGRSQVSGSFKSLFSQFPGPPRPLRHDDGSYTID